MARKSAAESVIPDGKPTLEEFRGAVKQVLMEAHGALELVADALLESEDDYIRSILDGGWDEDGKTASLVLDVAGEIAIRKPRNKPKWVVVEEEMVVLDTSGPLGGYLDAIAALGLHGETRSQVVQAMMARGIESVLHLLPTTAQVTRR